MHNYNILLPMLFRIKPADLCCSQSVSAHDSDIYIKTNTQTHTHSHRCIQNKVYAAKSDGRGTEENKIKDADRKVFYTDNGRPVRDGGGIEPDVPLKPVKVLARPAHTACVVQ